MDLIVFLQLLLLIIVYLIVVNIITELYDYIRKRRRLSRRKKKVYINPCDEAKYDRLIEIMMDYDADASYHYNQLYDLISSLEHPLETTEETK